MKKKQMRQILLPALLTSLVVAGVVLYKSTLEQSSNTQPQVGSLVGQPPIPSGIPKNSNSDILDQDGLYVDYKNGYTFEYPKGIFKLDTTAYNENNCCRKYIIPYMQENVPYIEGTHLEELSFSLNTKKSTALKTYSTYKSLPLNTPLTKEEDYIKKPKYQWPILNTMKIGEITNSGLLGVITYTYPTGGGEGEMSWGYTTMWQDGDNIISIGFFTAQSESKLKDYKSMYDNIVRSFKKIAPKQ